ncbi:hypothetical protein SAMD00019534_026010, partial [Acytostelium subglobosum LB1]|uniref:hypothetical protein n=1 Tax=Acytostelium subglobosum LB1 TaxID=1410327 RepID=UPI0006451000
MYMTGLKRLHCQQENDSFESDNDQQQQQLQYIITKRNRLDHQLQEYIVHTPAGDNNIDTPNYVPSPPQVPTLSDDIVDYYNGCHINNSNINGNSVTNRCHNTNSNSNSCSRQTAPPPLPPPPNMFKRAASTSVINVVIGQQQS